MRKFRNRRSLVTGYCQLMLRILRDQHSSLRNARRESYVGELIRRLETREPDLVRTLDPEKRDAVVRGAIASARQYGFTSRGPIRLYLDLCVSFGSGVVEDPM